jgi:LysM repeat protein
VALADKFGTTWQELAQLNSVGYPFTIYPGQVLKLPSAGTQEVEVQPETESAIVESPPIGNPAIFKILLPIIQLNSTAQSASSSENTPIVAKPVETVIVQSSNTLLAFSKGIGVDWHLLVELNDLHPPYLVHPGQVLKLR